MLQFDHKRALCCLLVQGCEQLGTKCSRVQWLRGLGWGVWAGGSGLGVLGWGDWAAGSGLVILKALAHERHSQPTDMLVNPLGADRSL